MIKNEQIEALIGAIRSISNGGTAPGSQPEGLEMVAIALAGEGNLKPVGEGLSEVAQAINNLADAIREVGTK